MISVWSLQHVRGLYLSCKHPDPEEYKRIAQWLLGSCVVKERRHNWLMLLLPCRG